MQTLLAFPSENDNIQTEKQFVAAFTQFIEDNDLEDYDLILFQNEKKLVKNVKKSIDKIA